jgi:hypothetical protein
MDSLTRRRGGRTDLSSRAAGCATAPVPLGWRLLQRRSANFFLGGGTSGERAQLSRPTTGRSYRITQ